MVRRYVARSTSRQVGCTVFHVNVCIMEDVNGRFVKLTKHARKRLTRRPRPAKFR